MFSGFALGYKERTQLLVQGSRFGGTLLVVYQVYLFC